MEKTVRFGVSMEKDLLEKFDDLISQRNYKNRSEALRDLIRSELVKEEWLQDQVTAGVLSFVYDHHIPGLMAKLTDIQHEYGPLIHASMHIHIDHHNCLETIVLTGKARSIQAFADKMLSIRGVKHGMLHSVSRGSNL